MIPYQVHRQAIEQLYEDRATIRRFAEEEAEWGETRLPKESEAIHQDVPCRISQRALAVNTQTETTNQIAYEAKLFLSPEIDIRQGDIIEVTRQGITRKYTAGEPFIYPTHQEISLQRKDYA